LWVAWQLTDLKDKVLDEKEGRLQSELKKKKQINYKVKETEKKKNTNHRRKFRSSLLSCASLVIYF